MTDAVTSWNQGLSRLVTGESYLSALKRLVATGERNDSQIHGILFLPANMLAGFALELLLKAFLLIRGYDAIAVRKMGHDIAKLYEVGYGGALAGCGIASILGERVGVGAC